MQTLLNVEVRFKGELLSIARAKKPKIKANDVVYHAGATKVFVGAIPYNVTPTEFRDYFTRYGLITDFALPHKDKHKGINKGHGFVNYEDPLSAEKAIEERDNHFIRAKLVR